MMNRGLSAVIQPLTEKESFKDLHHFEVSQPPVSIPCEYIKCLLILRVKCACTSERFFRH